MAKIKFNTNSKLKCVCGHNLRITDVGEDGIKFEKFCPQCGRTTHVDDKGTESGGEFEPDGAAHFIYDKDVTKRFSGTLEREHDLIFLTGNCHHQYENGESFYLIISRINEDGKVETIKKDYTKK